jgi:hypothetical protein
MMSPNNAGSVASRKAGDRYSTFLSTSTELELENPDAPEFEMGSESLCAR